jgi:hypothetical protein
LKAALKHDVEDPKAPKVEQVTKYKIID